MQQAEVVSLYSSLEDRGKLRKEEKGKKGKKERERERQRERERERKKEREKEKEKEKERKKERKKRTQTHRMWWLTPIISALWETEAEVLLDPRSLRLQ